MAEIDSLSIQISADTEKANTAIRHLIRSLGALSTSLKFDTSSLENLGKINGNNFKKLGEGLQSFSNAAKSLQNVDSGNFSKLAGGIERIASIDASKLEALGKIDGNSFRGLGEGVKALSSGLQNLQGVKKSDFNRLATGIERLSAIQPGNMEAVGNALRPLAEGINILSNAKFDNKNLTNLINSLTRLSNANTGSLANIDFSALGNSIKGLADTLSGAEKVQQNTISMTNAIAKLAGTGENANIVSAALPQLGEKLKAFMQTMAGAPQLESDTIAFTQALAQLANAGKRAESTASGLPKLGESLKNIFDTMSKMPTISENTIRMTQALAQLANAGGKAGNAAGNLNGRINTLSSSMLGLRGSTLKAVGSLKNFARQLLSSIGVYLGIYGAIRGAKKAIDISSDLTEVQNVVDVTFGDMAYKVEEFAETSIEKFGLSELALKQYSSRFQAMGSAMGIDSSLIGNANENLARMTDGYVSASDSMADMSLNLTKLTADMASFYNVEQDVVAEKLASIFTGQTRPLRDFGLDLTQATLQEWALKQGMDINIKAMDQMEKTMIRYQYVFANTLAAHGDFERTMYTWANQVRILKQNFEQLASVIGGALVNAFKPVVIAINKAMSAIIAFAKTISNSLGQIFGWTFEEGGGGLAQDFGGAADAADDMAGSIGDAQKSIDKMKAGLRAFDELKVINLPDGKDGGAGTGGAGGLGGAGGALGGQWIQGESILKKYESELDTLYKLGDYIGKKLTEAMDSIDWDSVYEKARNFGKGLADFLNGLISPDLFGALGRTIAGALNTALYAALSFSETFDWKDFGLSIATGINNFFAAYDFKALAQTLNVWAKGILDTAITAIDNTDWEEIGRQIGRFIEEIDFIEIGMKIGKLIWKAINAGVNALSGMFDAAPIETTIIAAVALPKVLKVITATKFIKGIKNLGGAAKVAADSFSLLRMGIADKQVWTGFSSALGNIRDNLTKMQKFTITAVAGFAEFKVISNTFEGLTLGTENLLTGIGKIAGVAAVAATAMYTALGPAGLAIAAITGVIAALKGVRDAQVEALEKFAEEQELSVFGEHLSDISARINETSQAIHDRIEASEQYVKTAGFAETQMAQDLADRYFDLSEKQNRSNEETDEMQRLAGLLIEKMPDLQEYYNEQTGLIDTTRESVEKLIEQRLKEIQLNAVEDKLTEAYQDRINALDNINNSLVPVQQAQEEMTRLQREYNDAVSQRDALEAYQRITEDLSVGINSIEQLANNQELFNLLMSAGVDSSKDFKDIQAELKDILTKGGAEDFPTFRALGEQIEETELALEMFQDDYNTTMADFAGAEEEYLNVENHISDLSQMLSDTMYETGENAADNYKEATLSKIEDIKQADAQIVSASSEALSPVVGSFGEIGDNATTEFNKRVSDATGSTQNTVERYMNSGVVNPAKDSLGISSGMSSVLFDIGTAAMQGLENGISAKEAEIINKISSIGSNIAIAFKNILDIHSPSKVMFKLGDFTMQGLKEGMESLYQPILSSVKAFSYDVSVAPAPNLTDMYGDYQYRAEYMPQYGATEYTQSGYNQGNAETNALLRRQNELLEKILAKPNLSNGDVFSAAQTIYKREAIRRYGASDAVDPVWG